METESNFSNVAQARRRNPVRRIIDRLTSPTADSSSSAIALDRWHEDLRPAGRSVSHSRRGTWFQQGQLWADEDDVAEQEASPAQVVPSVQASPVPAPIREEEAAPAVREVVPRERMVRSRPARPEAAPVRKLEVMKFLQINGAVDGACREPLRFALPGRSFSPHLSLWKGSPIGTHFLTGC